MNDIYYFAYGSNMNHTQMKQRCPASKFIKRAFLENHKLVFDGYSNTKNAAVANIVMSSGELVWSGVFQISEKDLTSLDFYEGYPTCYDRREVVVCDDRGEQIRAIIYYRWLRELGQPSSDYMNIIIEGAIQCGLPEEYIQKLRKLASEIKNNYFPK